MASVTGAAGRQKCSICGKDVVEKFKPFCSPRCANVDLGRWLGEGYKLPSDELPEEGALTHFDDEEQ